MSDVFQLALERNAKWAKETVKPRTEDPTYDDRFGPAGYGDKFFEITATPPQKPKILWIGCSDSRVPETTLLDLKPGDVFVHRNIANVLHPGDISAQSVIQYAVGHVKVKHVVLCGHTRCGGCDAALKTATNGLVDAWLHPLRALRARHPDKFSDLIENKPNDDQTRKLAELNVHEGVALLRQNPYVLAAMMDPERQVQVHGCIYDISTGRLEEITRPESEEEKTLREKVFDLHLGKAH